MSLFYLQLFPADPFRDFAEPVDVDDTPVPLLDWFRLDPNSDVVRISAINLGEVEATLLVELSDDGEHVDYIPVERAMPAGKGASATLGPQRLLRYVRVSAYTAAGATSVKWRVFSLSRG